MTTKKFDVPVTFDRPWIRGSAGSGIAKFRARKPVR